MYIPRPWHQVLPFAMLLAGLYVGHNFGKTYDVVLFCISIYGMACSVEYYMTVCGILYQKYMTNYPEEKKEPRNVPVYHGENKVAEATFNMDAGLVPKMNKERDLAIALLRMKEFGNPPDLTESRWVRSRKFQRAEFVALVEKWHFHKVIQRKDSSRKNSPYIVADWDKLNYIARGESLPDPPRK